MVGKTLRYKCKLEGDSVLITDSLSGYELHLVLNRSPVLFYHCSFDIPPDRVPKDSGGWVTGRDISEYDGRIKDLQLNSNLQYIDVGAGLGEFVPRLVGLGSLSHKLIVIEPANYEVMQNMLEYARGLDIGDTMGVKVDELVDRCKILRDKTKVNLINLTLRQAIRRHPEIIGVADVVIDNVGASHYMSNHGVAWNLEKRLLKSNGRLFSEVIKSGLVETFKS